LHRQQLGKCTVTFLARVGKNHAAHGNDAVGIEKHVFRSTEAYAFRAEAPRRRRIGRRVRIAAHAQSSRRICPFHKGSEIAGHLWMTHRNGALKYPSATAIDRDHIAARERTAADCDGSFRGIDFECTHAADAWTSHAARNDRSMT